MTARAFAGVGVRVNKVTILLNLIRDFVLSDNNVSARLSRHVGSALESRSLWVECIVLSMLCQAKARCSRLQLAVEVSECVVAGEVKTEEYRLMRSTKTSALNTW